MPVKFFPLRRVGENKTFILILSFAGVIGICIGFFGSGMASEGFTAAELRERTLSVLFYSGKGGFSVFLTVFFRTILELALIFALNLSVFAMPMTHIYVLYKGYSMGFNSVIFLKLFGVGGSIYIILVYIPIRLLNIACMIAAGGVLNGRCFRHRSAKLSFHGAGYAEISDSLLAFALAALAVCVAEAILYSIFASSLIFLPIP